MSPLVRQVLAEPEFFRVDAYGYEELVRESQVIGDVLVCHETIRDRRLHGDNHRIASLHLLIDSEERHLVCGIPFKAGMVFLLRMDEYLGFGLGKLPQPDHSLSWRYLVSVGFSYLDCTEGELVPVKPEQAREIGEHPLCGLRPEVSLPLGTRTDGRLEHEVEVEDLDCSQRLAACRARKCADHPCQLL